MNFRNGNETIKDNADGRSGIERRKFSYTAFIPERRSGKDRRKGFDRRSSISRRRGYDRRHNQNNRKLNAIERKELFLGI
jgi:hypothetical protein